MAQRCLRIPTAECLESAARPPRSPATSPAQYPAAPEGGSYRQSRELSDRRAADGARTTNRKTGQIELSNDVTRRPRLTHAVATPRARRLSCSTPNRWRSPQRATDPSLSPWFSAARRGLHPRRRCSSPRGSRRSKLQLLATSPVLPTCDRRSIAPAGGGRKGRPCRQHHRAPATRSPPSERAKAARVATLRAP